MARHSASARRGGDGMRNSQKIILGVGFVIVAVLLLNPPVVFAGKGLVRVDDAGTASSRNVYEYRTVVRHVSVFGDRPQAPPGISGLPRALKWEWTNDGVSARLLALEVGATLAAMLGAFLWLPVLEARFGSGCRRMPID